MNFQQVTCHTFPHQTHNPLFKVRGLKIVYRCIIAVQGERHFRMTHGHSSELLCYMSRFRRAFLKRPATGWNIKKQILNSKLTAQRSHYRILSLEAASLNHKSCAEFILATTCSKLYMRYGCN